MGRRREQRMSVGRPMVRVDGLAKVLGCAKYAGDVALPGTVHAVLVQSTVPHGRLIAMETEHASRAHGVLAILTPFNCPMLAELPAEITNILPSERRPPLSDDAVEYAGQHLAIVVAETLEEALYAGAMLPARYEESEALLRAATVAERLGPDGAQDGRIRGGTYLPDHFTKIENEKLQYARGSIEGSRPLVAESFATPVEHQNPIEPSSTLAAWDGDQLLLYDSTRWLQGSRKTMAAYLQIPEERIRVVSRYVGGAFGSKGFLWQHVVLAAVAAFAVRRPVKLVLERAQMFTSVGHRPETQQELAISAAADGELTGLEHHTLSSTSTVGDFTEPCGMSSRNLYTCPNVRISHRVARTHSATPCFMRAPGEASGVFALESAMDEVAVALGMDPMALRMRNYAGRDQDGDKPWSSKHLDECYGVGAERFGWERRDARPRSMTRGRLQVGMGMATACYPGRRSEASARATVGTDGRVVVSAATHELGTGVRTVMTQIAAEALGIPMEEIRFVCGDSELPEAPYTGASQTSATVGPAVQKAASGLRERLIRLAIEDASSSVHGLDAAAVELGDGWLSGADGGSRREHYRSVLARHPEVQLVEEAKAAAGEEMKELRFDSFGAHFAEVLVDEDTGEVRVSRWVGVFDGGRILNPRTARSQIMGGIVFGIGMALMEKTHYDGRWGLPVNASLAEYHVPTNADVPETDISFVEYPDFRFNPLGVRGIGELGIVGAPAAIANAIFHATGRRIRELPITPEKLMRGA